MTALESTNQNLQLEEAQALLAGRRFEFSNDTYNQQIRERFDIAGPEYFLAEMLEIFDNDRPENVASIYVKVAPKTLRSSFESDYYSSDRKNCLAIEAISRFIVMDASTLHSGSYLIDFTGYLTDKVHKVMADLNKSGADSDADYETIKSKLQAVYRPFFRMLNSALAAKSGLDGNVDYRDVTSTADLLSTQSRLGGRGVCDAVGVTTLRGSIDDLVKRSKQGEFDNNHGLKGKIADLKKRYDAIPRARWDSYAPYIFNPFIASPDEMRWRISDDDFFLNLIEDQLTYLEGFAERNEAHKAALIAQKAADEQRELQRLTETCDKSKESVLKLRFEIDALEEKISTIRTEADDKYGQFQTAMNVIGQLKSDIFEVSAPVFRNEKYVNDVLALIDQAIDDLKGGLFDRSSVEKHDWEKFDEVKTDVPSGDISEELVSKLNGAKILAEGRKTHLGKLETTATKRRDKFNSALVDILDTIKQLRTDIKALKGSNLKRSGLAFDAQYKAQTAVDDLRERYLD